MVYGEHCNAIWMEYGGEQCNTIWIWYDGEQCNNWNIVESEAKHHKSQMRNDHNKHKPLYC